MSEKRVYQDKMLNSKKEIVVCNWERGDGKTYSVFKKIMEDKNGKYLYISPFEPIKLRKCFEEYIQKEKDGIKSVKDSRDKIFLEYNNGNVLEVFYIKPNTQFRGHRNIKIAFSDECYLDKYYIDTVLKPMDVGQVYIMITNNRIEYIDSKQIKTEQEKMKECLHIATKGQMMNQFIDASIVKLVNEFSLLPQNEKTTLTRNSLLDMMIKLQSLKK